jgi:hypothetical protein
VVPRETLERFNLVRTSTYDTIIQCGIGPLRVHLTGAAIAVLAVRGKATGATQIVAANQACLSRIATLKFEALEVGEDGAVWIAVDDLGE